MAKPNAKAPVGQGGRFAALKAALARSGNTSNPGAVAASIGRKKYGAKRFQAMAKKGKEGSAAEEKSESKAEAKREGD